MVIPLKTSVSDLLLRCAEAAGCGDPEGIERALRSAHAHGHSLVEAVLDSGLLTDEVAFLREVASEAGLAFETVPQRDPSQALHHKLPARIALRHRILPDRSDEHRLRILTFNPFDLDAMRTVGEVVDREIEWAMAPRHRIIENLSAGYGVGAATFDDILESREFDQAEDDALAQEVTILEDDEEATVMSFVNQIFREALRERATDIHIEPLENDLRIRYRVDGALQEVSVPPNMRLLQASLVSRLKIMAHLDIAERRLPQDGRINLELDGKRIDVRVATIPSVNGESVSLRLLAREQFDFATLALGPELEATIRELLELPNGIILVTGPTGSGKSTTLYTFLKTLNTSDRRIVTIEDPVENKLDGVVQIAVKPEIKLTFASGLRSILRGDPNVIMVGEMRDLETTEIAIRGALTGHLVFSTLHTNDAIGGISRLLDMGIEPFLIASSVRAFIAQRLVRALCPACKAPADEHQDHDQYLESIGYPPARKASILRAVGCEACRGTGYRGRMAIMEICVVDNRMQEMISDRAPTAELRARARGAGMHSIREHGWQRVADGQTTIEEVLAVTAGDQARDRAERAG